MKLWIRWLVGLTVAAMLVVAYPLSEASAHVRNSALIGWSVGLVVSLGSGFFAFWSLGLPERGFLAVAFGGILVRLALVAGAVVVAVRLGHVRVGWFLVGLLGSYGLYRALEVILLNRLRSTTARASRRPRRKGEVASNSPGVAP